MNGEEKAQLYTSIILRAILDLFDDYDSDLVLDPETVDMALFASSISYTSALFHKALNKKLDAPEMLALLDRLVSQFESVENP